MTDGTGSRRAAAGRTGAGCAVCGRPVEPAYRPFCSKRCADVDLGRWLGGAYRIAVDDPEAEIEEADPRADS